MLHFRPDPRGARLWHYRDPHSDPGCVEQLFDVRILQGNASPRPISSDTAPVDIYLAAEFGILRRHLLFGYGVEDTVVFGPGDEFICESPASVLGVWIAEAEREVKLALVILYKHIKLALGRFTVPGTFFIPGGGEPESH